MFESLQEKFGSFFRNLAGKGKISESNVRDAMTEVRTALLEADVHFDVVNTFVADVTQKAIGTEVLSSLEPGQMMIEIVYDELIRLMGSDEDLATMPEEAEGAASYQAAATRLRHPASCSSIRPPPSS